MTAERDRISRATRNAIRRPMNMLARGAICEYWENEGFQAVADYVPTRDDGVRRTAFDSYAAGINWADEDQARRALRVFESLLRRLRKETSLDREDEAEIRQLLSEDGCRLDEDLHIHVPRAAHLELHLAALGNASGIRSELERVRRVGTEYPDDAIGAAKQLIEATAKLVLHERGLPVNEHDDVPALIKQAQQALRLHPAALPAPQGGALPDNAESIKRILGALSSAAIGIAELRNRYGTGHGRLTAPTGLGPRHARFAVGTACTWCELLLDTLQDPDAPWRNAGNTSGGT